MTDRPTPPAGPRTASPAQDPKAATTHHVDEGQSATGEEDPGAALDDPATLRALQGETPGSTTGPESGAAANDKAGRESGSPPGFDAQREAGLDRLRRNDNEPFSGDEGSVDPDRG